MNPTPDAAASPIGLGIDVGGTATRWALASAHDGLLAQGQVGGFTALMMGQPAGRHEIAATLADLARAVLDADRGRPTRVYAGITAYSDDPSLRDALAERVATALMLAPAAVTIAGDIELAYRDALAPGEGYLVYAGTGSIAAFIDEAGTLHRVGGRGSLLDDGGSGHWVAREAMRRIWRAEDERPGAWRDSAMARAVFARLGGPEWARSREFVYQSSRGRVGELALAVAEAADADPQAHAILAAAGGELGRLAAILIARFGTRRVVLAGRAARLHPVVEQSFRAALPAGHPVALHTMHPHQTAARLALAAPPTAPPPDP